MKSSTIEDKIGICSSALCMVHCIAVPIFLVFGFKTGLEFVDQEWVEWMFIGFTLVIGLASFVRGFSAHRQHFIPVLFIAGFLLLINGESITQVWASLGLSLTGALIIIYAHVQNLKWKRYAFTN